MTSLDKSQHAEATETTATVFKPWRPPANTVLTVVVVAALALAGGSVILAAWGLPPFSTDVVSTENAYVRGRTTVISPQVSGYIKAIAVQDYESVGEGQTLLQIDDEVYRQKVAVSDASVANAKASLSNNAQLVAQRQADVATAEAKIESARAQLAKADADRARADQLVRQGSLSVSELDASRAAQLSNLSSVREAEAGRDSATQALLSARANAAVLNSVVASAEAQLALALIDLRHTTVLSPVAGELSDIGARRGQYVTSGTQLMFLVPKEKWIIANFKEAQTSNIRPGQRAWFRVDALGGKRFSGVVERLSPAAGSEYSILRTDNAIGNFTKVPQRISVKIAVETGAIENERLKPGMSVEVHVDTASPANLDAATL